MGYICNMEMKTEIISYEQYFIHLSVQSIFVSRNSLKYCLMKIDRILITSRVHYVIATKDRKKLKLTW